jgi:hypothetical protein
MVRAVIPWEYPLDQLSLLNQNFRFDAVDCDIHSPVPRWSANTRAFSSDYQSSMDWRRRGKDRFSSTDSILLMSRAFGAYFALVGNLAGKLLRPAADETHSFARDTELLRSERTSLWRMPENRRLLGGAEWIRTLGSACLARKRPFERHSTDINHAAPE